jgi:hypothetical protein
VFGSHVSENCLVSLVAEQGCRKHSMLMETRGEGASCSVSVGDLLRRWLLKSASLKW